MPLFIRNSDVYNDIRGFHLFLFSKARSQSTHPNTRGKAVQTRKAEEEKNI